MCTCLHSYNILIYKRHIILYLYTYTHNNKTCQKRDEFNRPCYKHRVAVPAL